MNKKRLSVILLGMVTSLFFSASVQAHQGMPSIGARTACDKLTLGNACQWTDSHDAKYMGSCRKVGGSLLCVRNKPIVYPKGYNKDTHTADRLGTTVKPTENSKVTK